MEERQGVPHHLMEVLDLSQYYSASEFESDSLKILDGMFKENDVAVVCGGSVMYVDALCNGIDEMPTVPSELRCRLMSQWKENGDGWLIEELRHLDSVHFTRVDLKNMKRVFHAVEVSMAAGVPYSSLLTGEKVKRPFRIVKVWLDGDRDTLFRRINLRVEKMMADGLEEEARRVAHQRHLNSLNTVGLKEMFAYFDGNMTKEEAVARIQKNTRVYAKKQITWLKRDSSAICLDIGIGLRQFLDATGL